MRLSIDPRLAGVDSVRRQKRINRAEICSREADFRAAPGSMRDHAANSIGGRQQIIGLPDVARLNECAHSGTGYDRVAYDHRRHDVERNSGVASQFLQTVDITFSIVTKEKIRA